MADIIIYSGALLFFAFIWQRMRAGTLENKTWRTLLLGYKTVATPKELSGEYLNIIWVYLDDKYTKRVYKFYATPEGLLITPAPLLFSKENVLIPWAAIEPGELLQRDMGTMRRLQIADLSSAQLDIYRGDFIQYIRPRIGA